jgi:phage protein D
MQQFERDRGRPAEPSGIPRSAEMQTREIQPIETETGRSRRPSGRRRRRWPETTAAELKENFGSKHELRRAVDALDLALIPC